MSIIFRRSFDVELHQIDQSGPPTHKSNQRALLSRGTRSGALNSLGYVVSPDQFKQMHLALPGNLPELLEWLK